MRILIDIGHPAHVHFFSQPTRMLTQRGHELMLTSRVKEMAPRLLERLGIAHETISAQGDGGLLSLAKELVLRDARLFRAAGRFAPDVMAGIGGIFIAHVGLLKKIPALVFYDT